MISSTPSSDPLHAPFLELLPKLQTHATIVFRTVRCPDTKADKICETIALAWKWYCRLTERGKDVSLFPMSFVFLVAKAVQSGRRLCGQETINDILSPCAQRRHSFATQSLPEYSSLRGTPVEEALQDNTRTEVIDQVRFHLDFPAWRNTWTERDRRIIDELVLGERNQDVVRRFGITAGRVTQLRRGFREDWNRYGSDTPETTQV